jgi:N-acetylglucosamine kinase-like BadF-type ATPase
MAYLLGLDGGGTKTECVVLDAQGNVVGKGRAGPSNPLRCGFDTAFQSLSAAAAEALKEAKLPHASVTGVCAGLAGAGRRSVVSRTMAFLAQTFPGARAQVTTDYEIALEAAVGAGQGLVLIAGTGSVAYGRNAAGETARAGAYGPWIGDEGSAFDIGRRAVGAVARNRDTSAPPTLLSAMIPAALDCPDWDELMDRSMKNPDDVFPKLFPVVVAAAETADSASREILFASAVGLGNLAMTVVRKLGLRDTEFPLVKCGGVFGRSRMLDSLLDSVLSSGAPRAKISSLEISPAVGAARLAGRLGEVAKQPALHDARR